MSKDRDKVDSIPNLDLHFRSSYGKLFASLLSQFGSTHIDLIEDAIQNTFYKALKNWKPKTPDHVENWLFIVAKNDVLNQIKRKNKNESVELVSLDTPDELLVINQVPEDPRLRTLFLCAKLEQLKRVNKTSQVIFTLKNVGGFSIKEIGTCLSMHEDAVYKTHQRLKTILRKYTLAALRNLFNEQESPKQISSVEEVLYAIFSAGFDTLNKEEITPIKESACLEAFSLARLLYQKHQQVSTKNLMALFCFHLARTPARFQEDRLVSFFKQDRSKWDQQSMNMGFHFLTKPPLLDRYYLEALITSKHMTTESFDAKHWEEVINCYDLLLSVIESPVVRINRAYCIYKLKGKRDAEDELKKIHIKTQETNIYYALMMGELLQENQPKESNEWFSKALANVKQSFRSRHIEGLIRK